MVLCYKYCKTGLGGEGGDKQGKISLMVLELRGNTALQSLSLVSIMYIYIYIYIYVGVACWPLVPKFAGSNPA